MEFREKLLLEKEEQKKIAKEKERQLEIEKEERLEKLRMQVNALCCNLAFVPYDAHVHNHIGYKFLNERS